MVTFYESVVTSCTPSRRRLVYYWLDYSALRVINGTSLALSRHYLRPYRMLIHPLHLSASSCFGTCESHIAAIAAPSDTGTSIAESTTSKDIGQFGAHHDLPPPQLWQMEIPLNLLVTVRRGNVTEVTKARRTSPSIKEQKSLPATAQSSHTSSSSRSSRQSY